MDKKEKRMYISWGYILQDFIVCALRSQLILLQYYFIYHRTYYFLPCHNIVNTRVNAFLICTSIFWMNVWMCVFSWICVYHFKGEEAFQSILFEFFKGTLQSQMPGLMHLRKWDVEIFCACVMHFLPLLPTHFCLR